MESHGVGAGHGGGDPEIENVDVGVGSVGGEVAGGDIIGSSGGGAGGGVETPTVDSEIELTPLITRQRRNPSRNVRSPGDNVGGGGGNSEADDVIADLKVKWFLLLAALLFASLIWFSVLLGNHFIEIKRFPEILKGLGADSLIFIASVVICVLIRFIMRFLKKRPKKLQFVTVIIVFLGHSYLTHVCLTKEEQYFKEDSVDPLLQAMILQFIGVAIDTGMNSQITYYKEKAIWMGAVAFIGFVTAMVPKANEDFVEDSIYALAPLLNNLFNR
ncbi:Uncharacterized protein Fot_50387 [Forsythia ovata]|uniref:Uncharacterized protein n=1 Tax=Forsythia ovata TaxID=205694 RepID=A0ABD1PY36_9LAMI